jgi:DHA3 family macrolide efflux protein-like MFS transporter
MSEERSQSMTPFFTVWTGQAVSLLGSQLVQFALVWWLTETTGSATVLAGATIVALLPQILFSPFAGALVDRWNRRAVMIVADTAIALATLLLAALFARGIVEVWHVFALTFIRSLGGAFHWPAMQASTTLMVPQKHLARVAGLNQTLFGATNVISPPVGALLLQVLPMEGILAIDVATALFAILPLFFIFVPQPPREEMSQAAQTSVLADVREGLRFVGSWRGLMMILAMATLLNMLAHPAMSLKPIMVAEFFERGAPALAALESAFGIGMVLGGLSLSVWGGFKRRIVTAMLALLIEGVGFLLVGLTPATAFGLAVVAFFTIGVMNPVVNGSLMAVLQATVPPAMQGRVFTLVSSAAAAATPLGLVMAGPVADVMGVQVWFTLAGVATIAMASVGLFVPDIMNIEDRAHPVGVASAAASAVLVDGPQPAGAEADFVM